MKCICPMGGDRTCPDNCFIAVWHKLPDDQKTKERRRPIVEQLAKQGFTQQAIAMQLGVSQQVISKDLATLPQCSNVKGQGKDTRGRKKSTGRPKGSTKKKATSPPKPHPKRNAMVAAAGEGKSHKQIAVTLGVSEHSIRRELERDAIEHAAKAEPIINRNDLSLTAQEKFDIAIRQYKKQLDQQFHSHVLEEVRRRMDEIILPHWKEKLEQADKLYKHRRGAMDKETFNTIRRALHPDSRQSISDKKLAEAFNVFMSLEKYLLAEKDSPTDLSGLPNSWADWEKAKQDAAAERRSRRHKSGLQRV